VRPTLGRVDIGGIFVAEHDAEVLRRTHELRIGRHALEVADRIGERHGDDLTATLCDHLPELPLHREPRCLHSEAQGKDAIDRHRGAAALDVAEDGRPHLVAGHPLDLPRNGERDAAEALPTSHGVLGLVDRIRAFRSRTLRHDHEGEQPPAALPGAELGKHRLETERDLRDQDDMGAAGEAGADCDPAGIAPHYLEKHDAVVALRGGVQAVKCSRRGLEGGGESERHLGGRDVVVDRLRDTDHRQAVLAVEAFGDRQRAVAADHDDRVEPQALDVGLDGVGGIDDLLLAVRAPVHVVKRIAPVGGAEDRAASREDTLNVVSIQLPGVHLDQARETVEDADRNRVIVNLAGLDHGANDRVQTGCVAASREDADATNSTHALSSKPKWTSSIPACLAKSTIRPSR